MGNSHSDCQEFSNMEGEFTITETPMPPCGQRMQPVPQSCKEPGVNSLGKREDIQFELEEIVTKSPEYLRLEKALHSHINHWKELQILYDQVERHGPFTRTEIYQIYIKFVPDLIVKSGASTRLEGFQTKVNSLIQNHYNSCKVSILHSINEEIELTTEDINDIYREAFDLIPVDFDKFFTEGEKYSSSAKSAVENYTPTTSTQPLQPSSSHRRGPGNISRGSRTYSSRGLVKRRGR